MLALDIDELVFFSVIDKIYSLYKILKIGSIFFKNFKQLASWQLLSFSSSFLMLIFLGNQSAQFDNT